MVKTDHDLQLQPRNVFCDMIEKLVYWGPDYMANFSPASETNPFKIKLSITWRGIQPGLKILARFAKTGLGFSARPNGPENLKKSHVIETKFQPGLKRRKQYGCRWEVEAISVELRRWENLIRCLSNFNCSDRVRTTSLQMTLNNTTLSRKPWTRQAWRCLLFLCNWRLSFFFSYKLLKFFISFVTTVESCHATSTWKKMRWKSLCLHILKSITEIIKYFKSLYDFGGRCLKIKDVCMDFEPYLEVRKGICKPFYCWRRLLLVFSVTQFTIDRNKKSKPFNRLSPESGNRKKVDMQRPSPRFRSQQFFLWKICGETFSANL